MRRFETLAQDHPSPHVLQVTLNRPQVSNAFNTQMAQDLVDLFEDITMAPADIRAIILTGAGGDLKQRRGMSDTEWAAQHLVYERMVRAILGCPIPIIGAINGAAYGGGCELVAAMDFAYACDTARFAQTEVQIGIIPGAGGTQTLARAVGERRAKELILSGKPFSGAQALEWGVVNAVYPSADLMAAAVDMAKTIAANAPIAVKQAKQAIHKGLQMGLSDGLAFEIEAYNRTYPTQDRREGVAAFNENENRISRAPNPQRHPPLQTSPCRNDMQGPPARY